MFVPFTVVAVILSGYLFPGNIAAPEFLGRRIAVMANQFNAGGYLAFSVAADNGKLLVATSPDGDTWSDW